MATNRADTLDPALLRPGRLDRKIEFPLPDRRQKRLIFSTITGKMNLSEEVDLEDYVARPDKISGADINSICQEGGMLAVPGRRGAAVGTWGHLWDMGVWGHGDVISMVTSR
ncbi:26S proteasome regulatory subunit 6B isoform X1 [Gallus gallus]|uniref:26S proteasome regulatory subunit 6B isoform X1 n=1 Tax=Gallus gallus TaxID=9031 RepID=UPI001AE30F2C|nr:26S proteasome regulatory subunit 6B isoform X1 [Gallus gallus]